MLILSEDGLLLKFYMHCSPSSKNFSWNFKHWLPGRGQSLRSSSSNSGRPCVTSPRYCWCCCIWLCCACWSADTAGECDAASPVSVESNLAAGFSLWQSEEMSMNLCVLQWLTMQNQNEKWCLSTRNKKI